MRLQYLSEQSQRSRLCFVESKQRHVSTPPDLCNVSLTGFNGKYLDIGRRRTVVLRLSARLRPSQVELYHTAGLFRVGNMLSSRVPFKLLKNACVTLKPAVLKFSQPTVPGFMHFGRLRDSHFGSKMMFFSET